ncbi:hypothetical protein [Actinomyces timonensis]|jgi:hypothetical protein|uniref:phage tail tube protein n=1 Tax=Actinomyces timonensis TaxID=1288391 RepID=UPI00030EB5A2|nr:hypothetical protein [Actinomyces timonensis]DAV57395.1 MAG TPA: major tail protein [Caudoviricetes sp.]
MTYAKLDATQILQFGSDDDAVALAPLGTQLPTDLSALTDPWKEVGWINEDGMKFSPDDSVDKRKAHQGHRVYRTVMTDSSTDFEFIALQSNYQTLSLQWKIKNTDTQGGITTHTMSNARDIDACAIAVTVKANGHTYVYACSRFEVGERSEFTINATDDAAYSIKGTFASDIILITDDPNMKKS